MLEDIGKINLLIGPNNSGKTAILELLYLGGTSGRPCELILENVPNGTFMATTLVRFDFLGMVPLVRLHRRHGLRERWAESPATLTEESLSSRFSLNLRKVQLQLNYERLSRADLRRTRKTQRRE